MKKFFCLSKSGLIMLLMALFGLTGIQKAQAQELLEVKLGETLTLDYKTNLNIYKFVAPETGVLYIETTSYERWYVSGGAIFWANEECSQPMQIFGNPTDNGNGLTYAYKVTEGVAYYFSYREYSILVPSISFTFTMERNIVPKITNLYPEPGENRIYNLALAPELTVNFNIEDLSIENILMYYQTKDGEKTFKLDYYFNPYDYSWRINMESALNQLKNEIVKESVFKVVIVNPTYEGQAATGEYVVDGNIVLPYKYMPQTLLVSQTWPDPFLSYWPEGDPAGIATIVFDSPLKPVDQQNKMFFSYGIYAGNDYESETGMPPLPAFKLNIEGNTVTLDFTGVRRNTNEQLVTIIIAGLEDAQNLPVNYEGTQQIWREITYKSMDKITPVYEFTPGENANLSNVKEIELWMANNSFEHFVITGFQFDCEGNNVIVPMEDCTKQPDGSDYTLIYIPVPEIAKSTQNVKVSLLLNSLDGNDYDISVSYLNPGGTTGVDEIIENAENWTVYNLQGINVLNTANYGDVLNLPAGLYIVNGKKVIVNK